MFKAVSLPPEVLLVLVDGALGAEPGGARHHRDAVRLDRAVAAALADVVVDVGAPRRLGRAAALAAAPQLGGAGLVVDDDRDVLSIVRIVLESVGGFEAEACGMARKTALSCRLV